MDFFDARRLLKHIAGPACEAAGTGAAMLFLPATLMDLVLGTHFLDLLSSVALVLAVAAIAVVAFRASLNAGPD